MPNVVARRRRHDGPSLDSIQHFVLEDASWEFYERLLEEIGDRPIRVTYDNGRLEMMSPLPEHEEVKGLIHDFIRGLSIKLGIETKCLGSTTFRKKRAKKGLEPDDCYYFKHEKQMRGRKSLDLSKDPAPELVVEIDITRRSIAREPIYAALGVPEIWRWNGMELECLELAGNDYRARDKSLVFPFLAPAKLAQFIRMRSDMGESAIVVKFLAWVDTLPK